MNGRPWTRAQLRTLRANYPHLPTVEVARKVGRTVAQVYAKAADLGIRKSAAFMASDRSGRIQRGRSHPAMVRTQFTKGSVPWNKGTHYVAGGRSAETRFKPGQRSVRWDIDAYGLGALRVTTDGSLLIKYRPGHSRHTWMMMGRFVWWTETGHKPTRDQVVRAKNGDSHDTRIENLELITRAENARRNIFWTRYPREVGQLIQLKGAIRRQANRIIKEAT